MGCPTECEIGANLVFSICTHDPDTGVLTDADAAPAYRIYEDETGTAILNGDMAKLDDANTTGFYTESIAVSAGNGFENGKSYTIYIEATVDSDTGGISFAFKAYDSRKSDAIAISGSSTAADNLEASAETIVTGTVSHDNTAASTTVFYSDDITEATADHFNGRIVIFTSGVLQYQATDITDYALDTGEGKFTVTALTEAPGDNDTFVIV
jgi:hypothetical protein